MVIRALDRLFSKLMLTRAHRLDVDDQTGGNSMVNP